MNLNDFVTDNPHKTNPMVVHVINSVGEITYTYDAPTGFQLDQYVATLFPEAELMVYGTHLELNVSVIIPNTQEVYQIHQGIYRYG
jgi:hypothetical protein